MNVALFTSSFLEQTHHSIAHVLKGMSEYRFHVFAKRFMDDRYFEIGNIESRNEILKENIIHDIYDSAFIHSIYDGDTVFTAGRIANQKSLPLLLSFHGGFDTNAKIFEAQYKYKTLQICQQADAITVVCLSDVKRLKEIGVTKNINIIPVPIDLDILPSVKVNRDNYKIILIGRLISKKGVDIALKVLSKLPDKFTLTIIGGGEMENELRSLATTLKIEDRVKWLGSLTLNESLNELNNSSILLHPSRVANDGNADGTPQIILWSQALQIPVVSTLTGSIPEIVINNLTGLLVDTENIDQFVDAIYKLNNDTLVEVITKNAKEQVMEKHSLIHIVKLWKQLYFHLSNVRLH